MQMRGGRAASRQLPFRPLLYRHLFKQAAQHGYPSTSTPSHKFRTVLQWTFGIGLGYYGVFAVLGHHYSSKRRFERIREKLRTFAHDKLQRAKWKSVGDVEASLTDDDESPYNPPLVEIVTEEPAKPAGSGWGYGTLNFMQSPISFGTLYDSITDWKWPTSLSTLKLQMSTLMLELGRGEGSLWSKVVNSAADPDIHPEVQWEANVRLGDDLCFSEKAFLRERKRRMLSAFSRLLEVPVEELDERDLPILAIAASGGGFRAMCNTAGALRAAEDAGILDVTTYISAISGSCWTLGALYSGVAGAYTLAATANHLRRRVQLPYLDSRIFDMLVTKPTNEYLLTGLIQKAIAPNGSLSLVDIYGTLISTRLFCPDDLSHLDPKYLSLSHFRLPVDDASLPMPIFTAVSRTVSGLERAIQATQQVVVDKGRADTMADERRAVARQESSWLWYEFSPYEVGCDEIGAWIPTWSFGREFNKGRSLNRTPEISFTILAGIYASAFCASLQHYYQEVQPILSQLPGAVFNWITEIVNEREADFDIMHPIPPNQLPNFARGLEGQLREGSPEGFADQKMIGLMDAGAELNIPYYPLLRRNVDCIIALDASADSQDLWFTRAEAYAVKKGLREWPRGVTWPKEIITHDHEVEDTPHPASAPSPTVKTAPDVNKQVAKAAETDITAQADRQQDADSHSTPNTKPDDSRSAPSPLPSAYVWIGSSKTDESPSALIDVFDEEVLASRDGIGIVYMPILPNEKVVPGVDPNEISTWKFEMSMEESGKLMELAEYNFLAGEPKLRVILKAMWLRKMRARKAAEVFTVLRFEHPPP